MSRVKNQFTAVNRKTLWLKIPHSVGKIQPKGQVSRVKKCMVGTKILSEKIRKLFPVGNKIIKKNTSQKGVSLWQESKCTFALS